MKYSELQLYPTNFAAMLDAGWNGAQTDCVMAATLISSDRMNLQMSVVAWANV